MAKEEPKAGAQKAAPSPDSTPSAAPATPVVVVDKTEDDAPAPTPPAPHPTGLAVGHACLTSLRGILEPGEAVQARDFHDGQKAIDELIERGLIVKVS